MSERGHEPAGARLVGRDRELARIDAFLDADTRTSRGLVIRGEAGIGKTALWLAALERARARGLRTLVARPAEEESRGSLIGLVDLFEATEPEPALLAPDTDLFDRGRAVLRTLRTLSAEQPVVLAIDDGQWLDNVSARGLRYALRRLEDRPVWLIATSRTGQLDDRPLLARERTEELGLGPLPIEAIRQAIKPVVAAIPRPVLESIHRLSGGNPMYALELARTPAAASRSSLRATLSSRLAATPRSVRAIVQTAAALGPASPELLQRAGDDPDPPVADAIDRGLLTLDDAMLVRCAHPLLGSVALADMEATARRALRARLAGLVSDPEERARHLALAATERDASVAAELEAAARRAGQRGAPSAAAELAAHSVRLTPLDDGRRLARRAVAEILHRAAAGETARAIAMLDTITRRLPAGRERIAALTLRVGLDFGRADEVLAQARDDAAADELVRGRILDLLAYMTYMYRGDLEQARRLAAEALAVAHRHHDAELEMLASVTVATTALLAGGPRQDLMERALELGRQVRGPRLGRWPDVEQARHDLWAGHLSEARAIFERLHAMTTSWGIEFQRPYRLSDLAAVEVASGRLSVAADLADDGLESALDAGNTPVAMWLRYPDGLASAHRGDMRRATRSATEMRTWGHEHHELPRLIMADHVDGVVALAGGDPAAALPALLDGVTLGGQAGHAHPGVVPVLPDAVEAAAASGAVELAADLAGELDGQAAALGLPWVDAAARRGRGLAAVAAGDKFAHAPIAEAATAFDDLGYRLDAARAWWWHGRALQRTGRRAAAADALADAGARFRSMGADPWAAQAAADLERVAPGRATGALTATEARIAELVAAGHRNREVAATLFVSVATVEVHLTRIYRKLGVRSRTELSRHVLESRP